MKHFEKIASGVPVEELLSQLESHPELWDARPERRIAVDSPHAGMRDIWVRYNDISRLGENFNDEHVPVWYPAWKTLPALKPIVMSLMTMVEGEMIGGVLITKIPAGARVEPHIDAGWHVDYYRKFYVSLGNSPGSVFCCEVDGGTETLCPEPGDIWLFDNHKTHWVENNSQKDRITLIICIRTDFFGEY